MKLIFTIAPFAYMALIWVLSSLPSDAVIDTNYSWDHTMKEAMHLIEFAILYLLLVQFLKVHGKLTPKANIIVALIAIGYGLLDEVHQSFVPYRSATVIDFVKDTIGVSVSYYFVQKKMKKVSSRS